MSVQQNIANTATGVAVTSGMWSFMAENAPALGLLLTFVSICIATTFYYLNYRLNVKRLLIAVDDSDNGVQQKFSDDDMVMIKKALNRRSKREAKK